MSNLVGRTALGSVLALMLCSTAGAEEWKFAIEEIPGSIMDNYAQEFKRRIEAATDGDVTVTIYPLGSLGTPTEVAEQTADGIVHLSNLSVGNLGTVVPTSQILLTPYLFPSDPEETAKILAESPTIYNELGEDFEVAGLQLLTLYSGGAQVWTTKKEIRSPEDLANVKMRVMVSPILVEAYEDLGASPTPVPFGEVYGALQLGQVDGQINPIYSIEEMKFYEVTDYLIWAGEQELITAVMAGDDWYQGLPPERKQLLDDTIAELNGYIPAVVAEFNTERLETIREAKPGIEMIELTEEERAAFRERAQATHEAVADIVGARAGELFQALKEEIGQ